MQSVMRILKKKFKSTLRLARTALQLHMHNRAGKAVWAWLGLKVKTDPSRVTNHKYVCRKYIHTHNAIALTAVRYAVPMLKYISHISNV